MLVPRPSSLAIGDSHKPVSGTLRTLPERRIACFLERAHQTKKVLPCVKDYAFIAIAGIGKRAVGILDSKQPFADA
jgi:hypothetical protein